MTTPTFTAAEYEAHANGLQTMDPRDAIGRMRPQAWQVCQTAAAMLRQAAAASTRESALRGEVERLKAAVVVPAEVVGIIDWPAYRLMGGWNNGPDGTRIAPLSCETCHGMYPHHDPNCQQLHAEGRSKFSDLLKAADNALDALTAERQKVAALYSELMGEPDIPSYYVGKFSEMLERCGLTPPDGQPAE